MRTMIIYSPYSADVRAFKPGQLKTQIINNALCVSGIPVNIVAGVSDATSADYFSHGSFAGYIRQLTARYPVYKTGIPMFLAFYYSFIAETRAEPNTSRIRILAFLARIFCNIHVGSSVTSLYEEFRINLRWVLRGHKLNGLAGEELRAELERLLRKYQDVELFSREMFLIRNSRFFETTTGYIRMGQEGMAKGDKLYILDGCKWPVTSP